MPKKAIGYQEYKQAENNYNYYLQKKQLTQTDSAAGFRFRCPTGWPRINKMFAGAQKVMTILHKKIRRFDRAIAG